MKRKRFKHQAFTICHMFTGWQLYDDYKFLFQQENGIFNIDVLNKKNTLNNKVIKTLSIVDALESWLNEDLTRNNIQRNSIDSVNLQVTFKISKEIKEKSHTKIHANFECKCILTSGTDIYEERYEDNQVFN